MRILLALCAVVGLAAPPFAMAQAAPFSLEVRADLIEATSGFADVAYSHGRFFVGAEAAVRPVSALEVYAGYSRQKFYFVDNTSWYYRFEAVFIDSGAELGARLFPPLSMRVQPYVQAGMLLRRLRIEVEDEGVSSTFGADGDAGIEIGAGVEAPIASGFRFTLAGRYRRYAAQFDPVVRLQDTEVGELDVEYVGLGLGLRFRF